MSKEECIGFWGERFGHKYEAVFDEESELPAECRPNFKNVNDATILPAIYNACRKRKITYIKHVCVRCGDVIEKDMSNENS